MPRTRKLFPTPDDAESAFYDAFERADLAAMMVVWAEGEDVVCVHPSGPRLAGFEAVRESWMQIFASNVKLSVRVTESCRLDGPSVAVRSVVEAITTTGTESTPQFVNATNVYVLTDAGWRIAKEIKEPSQSSGTTSSGSIKLTFRPKRSAAKKTTAAPAAGKRRKPRAGSSEPPAVG